MVFLVQTSQNLKMVSGSVSERISSGLALKRVTPRANRSVRASILGFRFRHCSSGEYP